MRIGMAVVGRNLEILQGHLASSDLKKAEAMCKSARRVLLSGLFVSAALFTVAVVVMGAGAGVNGRGDAKVMWAGLCVRLGVVATAGSRRRRLLGRGLLASDRTWVVVVIIVRVW